MITGLQALRALPTIELVFLIGIPAFWIGSLILWSLWCLARGSVQRSERFDRMGGARVVPRYLLEYGYFMLGWQVRLLMAVGITANMLTVASLFLALGGAFYIGIGRFSIGGWLMFLSFFCDAYDGLVARAQGTASARGEYFDSFVDRYADLITSFGFLYYYKDDPVAAGIVALGMLGSTAMGYARAKGDAVGVDPNVGVMQRHERAVWLGVLTITAPIFASFIEPAAVHAVFTGGGGHPRYHVALFALTMVAIFSNISAVWRAAYVMRRLPPTGGRLAKAAPPAATAPVAANDHALPVDPAGTIPRSAPRNGTAR